MTDPQRSDGTTNTRSQTAGALQLTVRVIVDFHIIIMILPLHGTHLFNFYAVFNDALLNFLSFRLYALFYVMLLLRVENTLLVIISKPPEVASCAGIETF